MPSTYSTRARFTLQATGENFNTWGNILNTQDMQLIDDAIAGLYAFVLSGPTTLSANQGAADQSRMAALNITAGSGGVVTIPAVSKLYVVKNGAVGNAVFQPSGSSNSAIVYPGEMIQIATDGVNVWRVHATNFDGATLSNLGIPQNPGDAATKTYVDNAVASVVVGPFPPQAGNAGKFIGTDGNVPTWSTSSSLTWNLGGVQLGGTTNASPMLKPSGTTVQARLADNSGDAPMTALAPPQFDNTNRVATSASVKQAGLTLAGANSVTLNGTLPLTAVGALNIIQGSTMTVVLPAVGANNLPMGSTVRFLSIGGNIVQPTSGESIAMNGANAPSIQLGPGDLLEVAVTGISGWSVIGGTVNIPGSSAFAQPSFVTPPQFDSTQKLATTAFVQRAGGSYANMATTSGGQTLSASQIGQYVVSTGVGTVFLPLSSACPVGGKIRIKNNNATAIAIGRQGSDNFVLGNVGSNTQVTLESGGWIDCVAVNGGWYIDGTSTLANTGFFTHAFGTNGYQYSPGGALAQWMVNTSSATAGATIVANWNIAFPNYFGNLLLTGWASGPSPMANCHGYNTSNSQYQFVCILASTQVSAFSWGH